MRFTAGVALLLAAVAVSSDRPGEAFTRPLGFQLGQVNLEQVRQRLGPAPLRHSGDAGESEYAVCYAAHKAVVQVSFKSGAMGGAERELLGFSMSAKCPSPECLALSAEKEATLAFVVGGLKLGITRAAFRQAVGKVATKEAGHLVAEFEYTDSSGNTLITMDGRFIEDKLIEISVWRVVTQ